MMMHDGDKSVLSHIIHFKVKKILAFVKFFFIYILLCPGQDHINLNSISFVFLLFKILSSGLMLSLCFTFTLFVSPSFLNVQ